MTICIATDSFPPHNSGIATHNSYLATRLHEAGHAIVILTIDFNNLNGTDDVKRQDGLTVVTLKDSYREQFSYFSRLIRSGNQEAAVWCSLGVAMRKWLLENNAAFNFDLIECSDYGGLGIFLVDTSLPPVVIMCHSMLAQLSRHEFYNPDENLSLIRFLETNAIQLADAVICHSHSNADEVAALFNKRTRYATAPWISEPLKEMTGPKISFLVASRLQVCKGALVMAETLQSLQEQHPDIRVTWIGEDTYTGPGGSLVSKYIRKKFPSVWQKTFLWKKAISRKELLDTIDNSEVIIIPSAWETFNYVALEAASRKKALIITKQAGVAALFEDGKEILLTDAGNTRSIARAMLQLKQDKELVRALGENVLAAMERNFNKEKFLADRDAAYALAMQHRKDHPPVNPLQAFFTR